MYVVSFYCFFFPILNLNPLTFMMNSSQLEELADDEVVCRASIGRRHSIWSIAYSAESLARWTTLSARAWFRLQMVTAGKGSLVMEVSSGSMPTITGVVFHLSKASCIRYTAKDTTASKAMPKKSLSNTSYNL